jgi:excisionase family DNA binding protein
MRPDEILTPKELAAYIKVHEATVYRLLKRGEIRGFKIGTCLRFSRPEVDEWIARMENEPRSKDR